MIVCCLQSLIVLHSYALFVRSFTARHCVSRTYKVFKLCCVHFSLSVCLVHCLGIWHHWLVPRLTLQHLWSCSTSWWHSVFCQWCRQPDFRCSGENDNCKNDNTFFFLISYYFCRTSLLIILGFNWIIGVIFIDIVHVDVLWVFVHVCLCVSDSLWWRTTLYFGIWQHWSRCHVDWQSSHRRWSRLVLELTFSSAIWHL